MSRTRKFWAIFLTTLKDAYAYRAEGFVYFLADLGTPFLMIVVWIAVFQTRSQVAGYSLGQLLAYYLSILVFRTIVSVYPHEISERIKSGEFNSYLLKPMNIPVFHLFIEMAWKANRLLYLVVAWTILYFFLNSSVSFPHPTFIQIVFVILAVLLGLVLNYFVKFAMEMAAFWTTENEGIRSAYYTLESLVSGSFIPIDFLPLLARQIAFWSPTNYFYYFPSQILLGRISGPQALHGLTLTFLWVVFFAGLSKFLLLRGVRRYSAVSG